jgi:Leucine-rich repeat (LRR) protein
VNILQTLIDNSSETINMLLDDNEDGVMHPVELGYSEWVNGRLVALDCYLSGIMPCNLSGPLPQNIGDLEHLEALWLNGNQLSGEIPESMGDLGNLELLYLSDNQFSGSIPESFCSLNVDWDGANNWGVEYFNIWDNEICPPYPSCMDAEIVGEQSCSEFLGDLNGDGSLNILDIVIIANIILGSAENMPQADVNQDGELNILDIVILTNIILYL